MLLNGKIDSWGEFEEKMKKYYERKKNELIAR